MWFLLLPFFKFLHESLILALFLRSIYTIFRLFSFFSIYLFQDKGFDKLEGSLFKAVLGNKQSNLRIYFLNVMHVFNTN